MNHDEQVKQREIINQFFTEAFSKKRKNQGKTLVKFVSRTIFKFGLSSDIAVEEVIGEAYERALKSTDKGILIKNIAGWARTTCLNVIREYKRERNRENLLFHEKKFEINDELNSRCYAEHIHQKAEWSQTLTRAWRQLSRQEQEILDLRIVEGMSWRQVAETIRTRTGKAVKTDAVRKQGQRAKDKLKAIYLSLAGQ